MKLRLKTETAAAAAKAGRLPLAERAFTLLEVMFSAVIVAILFLATFYGISQGYNMVQSAREGLRATQIALSRMEGLRLELWGSSQLFNTNFVPTTFTEAFYPTGLGGYSTNNLIYSCTMNVARSPFTGASPPSYNDQMALVTVTVQWQDVHYGRTNNFSRTNYTYVAKFGIQNYVWAQPAHP